MTKNELIDLLKDNSIDKKNPINACALANISRFTNVLLQMDRKTLDYYYEIDINDLLSSQLPKDEYEVMKSQGWSIRENKIILYI